MRQNHNILGFVLLTLAVAMGVVGSGPGAQAQAPDTSGTQRTGGEAVGADTVHPAEWNVEREPYTFDDTYGYTLWYPDSDAAHDHGGTPALRVARAYELQPEDIEGEVEAILVDYPDLPQEREKVDVAREHEGVAVGPIPGSTPYTAVYVPVNGRVYKINVYADDPEGRGLDDRSKGLLADVRFEQPSRSVGSLDLPDANSPEALNASGDTALVEKEEAARRAETGGEDGTARVSVASAGEEQISEGCYQADPQFWVQTQHGKFANRDRWAGRRPGWTRIGLHNYWGEYTHGNLGYGRCVSNYYTNDKFAIDYFLRGNKDVVFSPFKSGTVRFAGRNESHKNYGKFVVIEHANGKYVSMSAHLSSLKRWVKPKARVDEDRVIGIAGKTGAPSVPVGMPHLHQAFYRNPSFLNDGSPYGGQGLQVTRHHFLGHAAGDRNGGVYTFGWKRQSDATCRVSIVCGKGNFISN